MPGRMVEFPANGGTASGYLSTPAAGRGPGVLVIQEWWGLVRQIKSVCDRLAAEGFTALAPDMYHGKSADEPDAAGKLFMALNIAQAEKDLRGAAKALAGHSSTAKLGAVGFCMGGQLALFAATLNPSIGATANFYYGQGRPTPQRSPASSCAPSTPRPRLRPWGSSPSWRLSRSCPWGPRADPRARAAPSAPRRPAGVRSG